jgi:hypothetical protein
MFNTWISDCTDIVTSLPSISRSILHTLLHVGVCISHSVCSATFLSPQKKICLPTSLSPICSKIEPSNVFFFQPSMSLVLVDKTWRSMYCLQNNVCLLVPDLVHYMFHSNVCNQIPFTRAVCMILHYSEDSRYVNCLWGQLMQDHESGYVFISSCFNAKGYAEIT